MEYCIDKKLLDEICTISTAEQYLVGKISRIYPDKFAVKVLSINNNQELIINNQVEIRVETLDNEIYFYVAMIESQHLLSSNQIIFLKPISHIHENNKRKDLRLKIEPYLSSNIYYSKFPSNDAKWNKSKLIDLSQGGLQFKSRNYLNKGELIEVKLAPPFLEKIEYIICRVINTTELNEIYYISVQFINISELNKDRINDFIISIHSKFKELSNQ